MKVMMENDDDDDDDDDDDYDYDYDDDDDDGDGDLLIYWMDQSLKKNTAASFPASARGSQTKVAMTAVLGAGHG